jgi:7-cyano-7-deazaguanine synthase
MKRAVVLLSGGVDSTTTLAIAKAEGFETYALSFDYGQRHRIELESARLIADKYKVEKHLVININLRDIGGSALTAEMKVPKDSSPITHHPSPIPVTYVPARNTIFLSFALAWAEVLGAEDIFIGANAVDYSGYPDCRPEYLRSFENMANLATKASVEGKVQFRIQAPLIDLTKGEIIRKGSELGVDYSLTWSCYDPVVSSKARKLERAKAKQNLRADFVPCLRCDSCLLRAKGFKEAGVRDPS